mmetsp:Transcript_17384/g.42174  ORF Transcript_17384/g.42174 Transcript_17384/m.42174 type:complete len:225 (+) Transcript_17384:675-1349(+)
MLARGSSRRWMRQPKRDSRPCMKHGKKNHNRSRRNSRSILNACRPTWQRRTRRKGFGRRKSWRICKGRKSKRRESSRNGCRAVTLGFKTRRFLQSEEGRISCEIKQKSPSKCWQSTEEYSKRLSERCKRGRRSRRRCPRKEGHGRSRRGNESLTFRRRRKRFSSREQTRLWSTCRRSRSAPRCARKSSSASWKSRRRSSDFGSCRCKRTWSARSYGSKRLRRNS